MECLFVGGPWDGFVRSLNYVEKYFVAYIPPEVPICLDTPVNILQTVTLKQVIYEPHFWHTEDHERIIYAPRGWTDLQVMDALINGYRAPSEAPSSSLPTPPQSVRDI